MRPVVHFEIAGSDRGKLCTFYENVFGWHIQQDDSMDYGMVDTHGGKGFNGGITTAQEGATNGVIVYVAVDELQPFLDKAVTLGGEIVAPIMEIPNVVTFALFKDPHGNVVGLVKGDGQGPQVSAGDGVPVTWFEIMGKDASIQDFYRELFEWKITDMAPAPGYGTVGWEEWGFGGGIGTIPGHHQSYVTIYPEVADVAATLKKVVEFGGSVVMEPTDMPEVGVQTAAFTDPDGNMIGAYKQIPMKA